MKLSIIIPVFNEEKTIRKVVDRVSKVGLDREIKKEIVIIDDGSTDKTLENLKSQILNFKTTAKNAKLKETKDLLRLITKDFTITIIQKEKNQGKGAAVRIGIKRSAGKVIIIQDADLEYSPSDYPKLLEPIIKNKAEVVYGSRMKLKVKPEFYLSFLGNKLLTWLTNLLFKSNLSDVFVGYKVFRRKLLDDTKLRSNGFNIEIELTAKFLKKKVKIKEVPISYQGRSWREGKKINFWDGLVSLFYVFYYRFFN